MEPVGHCGFQWVSVGSDDMLGSLAGFLWADIHQSVFIENIAHSQVRLVLVALGISFNKTLYWLVLARTCKHTVITLRDQRRNHHGELRLSECTYPRLRRLPLVQFQRIDYFPALRPYAEVDVEVGLRY